MAKVKFNLRQVHVAPMLTDTTWDTPVAVPGAVGLTLDAAGDESTFYADGKPYFVYTKNNGYTGTLEVAMFPDDLLAKLLGWFIDSKGKLVEDANGKPVKFALSYEVETDEKERRSVLYECQISRPSDNAKTTEGGVEPQTDTVNITAIPHDFDTVTAVKAVCHGGNDEFDTFFESVVAPAAKAAQASVPAKSQE